MAGFKGNSFQTDWLKLVFNAVSMSTIAVATTTNFPTIWVALHTADPGAGGNQSTSETAYGGYVRIATGRETTSTSTAIPPWQVTGTSPASASPLASIFFPTCTTSTTAVITNFSVGPSSSGATEILYSGPVTQNISVNTGVTPSLTTGTAITED